MYGRFHKPYTALPATGKRQNIMEIERMTKEALQKRLHDPATVIIDVRHHREKFKITGARLQNPDKVDEWASNYRKDQTLVLYCS